MVYFCSGDTDLQLLFNNIFGLYDLFEQQFNIFMYFYFINSCMTKSDSEHGISVSLLEAFNITI